MNHSLAAVASRIQERNNALRSELAALELLQIQHAQAKQLLKADERASAEARKEFLAAVRSRHGLELECIQIANDSRRVDESTSELKTNAAAIRSRTEDLERRFDEEHAPVYAKHDLSTKLHSMRSEARLVAAQRKKRRREERLRGLADRTERQRGEASEMRTEADRIREECLEMDRREEEDDEETVALNMQIKSVLANKASLRSALKEAREMQQTATSNRDTWERRCVEGK
mmetsp:Transcript_258/g.559  ORF Transcript_258/g.559 Transcript_258/m.559 type:complete len:232 (-) Transcript_258:2026-2721(-)